MFRLNRRHLCAEVTVEKPRAQKKQKEEEDVGRKGKKESEKQRGTQL